MNARKSSRKLTKVLSLNVTSKKSSKMVVAVEKPEIIMKPIKEEALDP